MSDPRCRLCGDDGCSGCIWRAIPCFTLAEMMKFTQAMARSIVETIRELNAERSTTEL